MTEAAQAAAAQEAAAYRGAAAFGRGRRRLRLIRRRLKYTRMAAIVLSDKSPQLIHLAFELAVFPDELIDLAVEHNQRHNHRDQPDEQ